MLCGRGRFEHAANRATLEYAFLRCLETAWRTAEDFDSPRRHGISRCVGRQKGHRPRRPRRVSRSSADARCDGERVERACAQVGLLRRWSPWDENMTAARRRADGLRLGLSTRYRQGQSPARCQGPVELNVNRAASSQRRFRECAARPTRRTGTSLPSSYIPPYACEVPST